MSKKKTNEEFVTEIGSINPGIIPLTAYIDSHSKVLFRCKFCGQEWRSYPYQQLHRTGLGCAKCSYKAAGEQRRKDNRSFIEELKRINPSITVLTPYAKSKQEVTCQCNLCNSVWETTPDRLLRGIGCPNCYHSSTSFIEQFIYTALCFVLGEDQVINRDKKAIGKELDIFVPSIKLAVEYGSWYWHKNRIDKDFEKQRLCKENRIKLLLIYDSCDDMSVATHENCYTFGFDLATEKSYDSAKRIVLSICKSYDLDSSELKSNWDNIVNLAYQKARKITTADFIELVKAKNSHQIEILGEYKSSYDPIHCRCMVCGYEWFPRSNNLLNENAGCPQCAGSVHYSNQEFISKVHTTNPDFELLEPFTSMGVSILCRCKKCGYEWKASPARLLQERSGCPKCIGHKHYSNEEFLQKLHEINPSVVPLEPYPQNNKTKIQCRCSICGNHFSMRPNNLLVGQRCPKCSNEERVQNSIKSNDEFVTELRSISPEIIALEPYSYSKSKIKCKCTKCNNEWKATPNSLLHGYGCPKCAVLKRARMNKKRVLCVETNTIYESLKDASAQSGYSNSAISMCCNGRKKTVGGYHWTYIEDK